MDRPGEFEIAEYEPREYRHPSGVLIVFGPGLDDDACHHWRSLTNIAEAEMNVTITRRTAGEPMTVNACMVGADLRRGHVEVRGYHDDDWTDMLNERSSIALSDIYTIEVL